MAKKSVIDSRDVKLAYLYEQAVFGTGNNHELEEEIRHRLRVDAIFRKFNIKNKKNIDINYDCLKPAVEAFPGICNEEWSDYSLKYVRTVALLCEKITADVIISNFKFICK